MAGFPGAGQTGLYRQYSQKLLATETGQQAMLEASTDWPGLRNRTNPRTVGKAAYMTCLLTCTSMASSSVSEQSPFSDRQETHPQLTGEVAAENYTLFCSSQAWGQDCQQGGHGSNYLRPLSVATVWTVVYRILWLDCRFLRRDLKPKAIFRWTKHCLQNTTNMHLPHFYWWLNMFALFPTNWISLITDY